MSLDTEIFKKAYDVPELFAVSFVRSYITEDYFEVKHDRS